MNAETLQKQVDLANENNNVMRPEKGHYTVDRPIIVRSGRQNQVWESTYETTYSFVGDGCLQFLQDDQIQETGPVTRAADKHGKNWQFKNMLCYGPEKGHNMPNFVNWDLFNAGRSFLTQIQFENCRFNRFNRVLNVYNRDPDEKGHIGGWVKFVNCFARQNRQVIVTDPNDVNMMLGAVHVIGGEHMQNIGLRSTDKPKNQMQSGEATNDFRSSNVNWEGPFDAEGQANFLNIRGPHHHGTIRINGCHLEGNHGDYFIRIANQGGVNIELNNLHATKPTMEGWVDLPKNHPDKKKQKPPLFNNIIIENCYGPINNFQYVHPRGCIVPRDQLRWLKPTSGDYWYVTNDIDNPLESFSPRGEVRATYEPNDYLVAEALMYRNRAGLDPALRIKTSLDNDQKWQGKTRVYREGNEPLTGVLKYVMGHQTHEHGEKFQIEGKPFGSKSDNCYYRGYVHKPRFPNLPQPFSMNPVQVD